MYKERRQMERWQGADFQLSNVLNPNLPFQLKTSLKFKFLKKL